MRFAARLVSILILAACAAGTGGCGYHFAATGEPVGIRFSSLAVPVMKSTSSMLGFEADFSRVIREEFMSHADVPIVSEDQADVILTGRVYGIETDPYTYSSSQFTVQGRSTSYEVTSARWIQIKVDFKLVERSTGKVIWQDKGMKERAFYYVTDDPLANRYYQRNAVEEMAGRLAKWAYLRTMQRF
jgi:outer membrane lipopolysaccharide assembly protein LptE/RlpB